MWRRDQTVQKPRRDVYWMLPTRDTEGRPYEQRKWEVVKAPLPDGSTGWRCGVISLHHVRVRSQPP